MRRIRDLRKEQKITMKSLGEAIGVAESTISLYENGKRQPDNDTLQKLADYFNTTTDYLLGRTDEPSVKSLDEQLEGIDFALYGETKELSETQKQDVLKFIKFLKSKDEG